MTKRISGLYAITPDEPSLAVLLEKTRQVIAGGVRIIQYRNKSASPATRLKHALALAALARQHDVVFIVNDTPALALAINADGMHQGKNDGDLSAARTLLPQRIIGVSCYSDLSRALAAERAGADYVAFGSAFSSLTKPGAAQAPLALYREAVRKLCIPVVAIGGINTDNARALLDVGVAAVAVLSALFNADDITAKAREFCGLFEKVSDASAGANCSGGKKSL